MVRATPLAETVPPVWVMLGLVRLSPLKVRVPGLVVRAPGEERLMPFNTWVWAVMDVVGLDKLM